MMLDEALREASEAIDRATEPATPSAPPRPGRRRPLPVAVLTGAVIAGLAVMAVAVAGLLDRSTATTEATDVGPFHYVTDAGPEGLSLDYAGPVAELGSPIGTETRWIYGHADRGPAVGERPVVVMVLTGEGRPPGLLDGRDVDIDGVEGRVLPDGMVMFGLEEAVVLIDGGGAGEDLVALAREIEIPAGGGPIEPPAVTPGGFEVLGRFEEGRYAEVDGAVPAEARVATYRQGYVRYLSLVAQPRSPELDHLYRWLIPADAETLVVGERTFTYVYSHDRFGAPATYAVWFDDGVIGEALSYGIERSQIDTALAAVRTSVDRPVRADATEAVGAGPGAEEADEAPTGRLANTVVLDGLEIVNAVDHDRLGSPDWSAEQYLFGPSGVDAPGPDDPVLLLTVARGSSGLLAGEPIEIGGHAGVIVDQAAAGSGADLELLVGDTTVSLTGLANLDLDAVMAAAEQYTLWVMGAGGLEIGVPSTIGVDLVLRDRETIGAWLDADVNGPLAGTTVVYAEPGTSSADAARRLTVTSSGTSHRSVDWLRWLHPGLASVVDVGGTAGVLVEPTGNVVVLRFETAGRVIEIVGTGVGADEVLAAAAPFLNPVDGG